MIKIYCFIFILSALGFFEKSYAYQENRYNLQNDCISDFRHQTRQVLHHLPQSIIYFLETKIKNPMEGWKVLSDNGDAYASVAEKVLQENVQFPYSFYHQLIRKHWYQTAGDLNTQLKFESVAEQHFFQYVEIIKTGFWPDSDQIINSYLKAIRNHHLEDITVFDAAWEASGMNKVQTWQALNQLSKARTVQPTRACFEVDKEKARRVIFNNFKSWDLRL